MKKITDIGTVMTEVSELLNDNATEKIEIEIYTYDMGPLSKKYELTIEKSYAIDKETE